MYRLGVWPLALLALCAAPSATSADPAVPAVEQAAFSEAERELLRSARTWDARGRGDLARQALEKLLLARPGDTRLMLDIGLIELRSNRMSDARTMLARLEQEAPDSIHTRELRTAYRIATQDRLRLASVKRLIELSRFDEALSELQALFPDGAPSTELGIDYWQIVGKTPGGGGRAEQGLQALIARHPDDPRFQLALAEHYAGRDATRGQARQMLRALRGREDLNPQRLANVLNRVGLEEDSGLARIDPATVASETVRAPARPASPARIADGWRRKGETELAEKNPQAALESFAKAQSRVPDNAAIAEGRARALLMLLRYDEALAAAPASQPALRAEILTARAAKAAEAQRGGDVLRDLDAAQLLVPKDPWARYRLARHYASLGLASEGRALMDQGLALTPKDADLHYARALYLASVDADQEALNALAPIPVAERSPGMRDLEARARASLARAETQRQRDDAQRLAEAGDLDGALRLIDALIAQRPDDAALHSLRGDVLAAAGRWADAQPAYAAALALNPDDHWTRLGLARSLHRTDQAAARVELDRVLATSTDGEQRLSAARQLETLGDVEAARTEYTRLAAASAPLAGAFEQLGWLDRSERRYAEALKNFRSARQLRSSDAGLDKVIAEIQSRPQPMISMGYDHLSKPGDPGLSDTTTQRIPLELRVPRAYDGHYFALAEWVDLDVGRLPTSYDEAALYGTVLAAGPDAVLNFPQGLDPATDSVALGLGYDDDALRLDLGTTPLGMPVQDLIGGIRYDGRWSELSYSVDLSRRPISSSLLSFGGARDPVSGRSWGGARENGASLRLAHYGPQLSLSGSVEASRIEGRNILDNDFFGGRLSADYKFYDAHGQQLLIGVAATYWNYAENQRYFSFGHGGYYSPQSYVVTSLPLEWRGRWNRWSYRFEGAVSHSSSDEDDAPFYPTDPGLQAQASTSTLPSGFSAPIYEGGSGSGSGYRLRAELEYRLDADWVIGARAGVDRSDFYEPDTFSIYFRHLFNSDADVLSVPPRPTRHYTDF